jgi:hypothetical protein
MNYKRRICLVRKLFLGFFLIIILMYSLPFFYLVTIKPDARTLNGERLIYYLVTREELKTSSSPKKKVMDLLRITKRLIRNPYPAEKVNDVSRLHIIESGYGFCDQQANVFLALCEANGFQGRMIWLFGEDSISHHTVSEVFYDDKYHMFDPFYMKWFHKNNHEIASVNDIIIGNIDSVEFKRMPKEQRQLYGKNYPWKIAKRTSIMMDKSWISTMIFLNSDVFGEVFYKPFIRKCNVCDTSYKSILGL